LARIAGVDLPLNKRIQIGLTYIFGIGKSRATKICREASINIHTKVKDLTEDETVRIRNIIQRDGMVEGDMRKAVSMDIKRLMEIGSYRGLRHRRGLPVRGQRKPPTGKAAKKEKSSTSLQELRIFSRALIIRSSALRILRAISWRHRAPALWDSKVPEKGRRLRLSRPQRLRPTRPRNTACARCRFTLRAPVQAESLLSGRCRVRDWK
jgi:small subunit ribosomal protein S13